MPMPASEPLPAPLPDWEAFYRDYRKPGYVPGFEITSKLGGGMFGLVFRARKQSIGKDYAIKFLKVEDGTVARAVLAELDQVRYFAEIDHPNLVSIEDRGAVDGIPFLVMAFAGTETLKDRLRTDGQPPEPAECDELLRLYLQACRGAAALHDRSLVHFDIKPANVFLKGSVARLGDYGLSKLVTQSRGSLSSGRGTPYYMAPELLQRRGDARSDIYSLGVMLYELLCGQVPFRGDSEWEVLRKHEHAVPEWPAHLGGNLMAVLRRCLQKDPDQRFQSVHDLIAALGASSSTAAASLHEPAAPPLPPASADGALRGCVPPPLPEDHVAGLARASREALGHAKVVAKEALDQGKQRLQQAVADARSRRRAGWPRRTAPPPPPSGGRRRRARSPFWFFVVVGAVLLSGMGPFACWAPIKITRSHNAHSSTEPAFSYGVGGPAAPVAPTEPTIIVNGVVHSPPAPASAASPWLPLVPTAPQEAKRLVEQRLLPLRHACQDRLIRLGQSPLPIELPRIALQHVQTVETMLDLLVERPSYDASLAEALRAHAPAALQSAAQRLTDFGQPGAPNAEAARRLHRFLSDSTGFEELALSTKGLTTAQFERHCQAVGKLWQWLLTEVASDQMVWISYRSLNR